MSFTSTKTVTVLCAEGTSGVSQTAIASASSIISQRDADEKAFRLAQAEAFEALLCYFPSPPGVTYYWNTEQTASVNSDVGYVSATFTAIVPANTVYSSVSVLEANVTALAEAQRLALLDKQLHQRLLFYNHEQNFFAECIYPQAGTPVVGHVNAHSYQSAESPAVADSIALSVATSSAYATLVCTTPYRSTPQTYTATCGGGLVGDKVTITNPANAFISVVSQADANALSLADATARATALLVCVSGYYNTSQSFTANCTTEYGVGWTGSTVTVTKPAGGYWAATQMDADDAALAAATAEAISQLVCRYEGMF